MEKRCKKKKASIRNDKEKKGGKNAIFFCEMKDTKSGQ